MKKTNLKFIEYTSNQLEKAYNSNDYWSKQGITFEEFKELWKSNDITVYGPIIQALVHES